MDNKPKIERNRGNMGKGRPKGAKNKKTAALKEMILNALDKSGGEYYLMRQAEENPNAFLTLIGKVLPTTLSNDDGTPLLNGLTVQFINADKVTK